MNAQTVTIQIAPQTAALLEARAAAQGVSLDDLLRAVFEQSNGAKEERPFYETATPEEWVQEFTKWAESHGTNTPGLTREDVSRERMYED